MKGERRPEPDGRRERRHFAGRYSDSHLFLLQSRLVAVRVLKLPATERCHA